MPRNHSEKLPSHPEAWEYAKACRCWLASAGWPWKGFATLWDNIRNPARGRILDACGTLPNAPSQTQWRTDVASFIEANYGP